MRGIISSTIKAPDTVIYVCTGHFINKEEATTIIFKPHSIEVLKFDLETEAFDTFIDYPLFFC